MATRRYLVFGPFALLFIPFAIADNLTVDGKPYNGVYINETDSIYYVRDPSDGSMHSFSKSGSNVSGVSYTADEKERADILSRWRANRKPISQNALNNDKTSEQSAVLPAQSPTEGGAEDSVAATPVDPQEQYQRLKALREQAEFEAAYERWRQLTEEEREALITSVHATYGTRSANAAASIQQIRAKQSTVKSARTTSERQLDAIDEQEEWEISSVHTQTRTAVKKGEVAATAFESDGEVSARVGASGTSKTTDTYRRRVDPDAARMAIDDERQEVMKDVRDLHRREKRLAGDAALVRNALDAHEHLAAEELSLMSRLDAAFKAGYEPMLKTRRVDEWEDSITQETARFKISSKIWRIEWVVTQTGLVMGDLRVLVCSAHDSKPFTNFTMDPHPLKNFVVLDKPGEFFLAIKKRGDIEYAITVYEVRE